MDKILIVKDDGIITIYVDRDCSEYYFLENEIIFCERVFMVDKRGEIKNG